MHVLSGWAEYLCRRGYPMGGSGADLIVLIGELVSYGDSSWVIGISVASYGGS